MSGHPKEGRARRNSPSEKETLLFGSRIEAAKTNSTRDLIDVDDDVLLRRRRPSLTVWLWQREIRKPAADVAGAVGGARFRVGAVKNTRVANIDTNTAIAAVLMI